MRTRSPTLSALQSNGSRNLRKRTGTKVTFTNDPWLTGRAMANSFGAGYSHRNSMPGEAMEQHEDSDVEGPPGERRGPAAKRLLDAMPEVWVRCHCRLIYRMGYVILLNRQPR